MMVVRSVWEVQGGGPPDVSISGCGGGGQSCAGAQTPTLSVAASLIGAMFAFILEGGRPCRVVISRGGGGARCVMVGALVLS